MAVVRLPLTSGTERRPGRLAGGWGRYDDEVR